jgi:paraquat-inducible protein B
MFYDISSQLIELKNMNINVNFEGLNPLINGGIALVTIPNKKLTKHSFKLYSSYQKIEEIKKLRYSGFIKTAYFSNDFKLFKNMNIEYKNQTIGFIKNIKFKDKNSSIATLFIYNKYKNLISNHSRFYKKPAVNITANLSGLDIQIANFTSLLKGSIVLDNSKASLDKLKIYPNLKTIQIADNSIKIIFKNADGVNIGSKLEYKNLKIGEVIKINPTDKNTIVTALLYDKNFAKQHTIFYLKKPIVSLNEIKNASALILPVNIGVVKGNGTYQTTFKGYENKPLFLNTKEGKIFKIYTDISTLSTNAPVYYKNIPIGKIVKVSLSNDASKVVVFAFIKNKYLKLIRKNSKFYNISGVEMKFSIFGTAKIKTNTLTSMLKGGILVVTPTKYAKQADINDTFKLIKNLPEDWQEISPKIP